MSEIVKELKAYSRHCRACGEETTAHFLTSAAAWIEVCEHTIKMQKVEITELTKLAGKRPKPVIEKAKADE